MASDSSPDGLATAGRRLWTSVVDRFDLDEHESSLLLQACRAADTLDRLAAKSADAQLTVVNARGDEVTNPLFVESRQQSLALSRLIASLRLPEGDEAERPQRRGANRASYGVRGVVS
jgi:hypothetical protein